MIEKTSGTVQMWRYLRKNCRKTVGKIKDLKFIEISPSVTECYTTKGKILRKKSIFKDISLYFKLTCIVSLRIQSECGKIRTRKTPNTDTFHAVQWSNIFSIQRCISDLEISQNSQENTCARVSSLRPATLLKNRFWHRCFSVNFAKLLRTPFLTEYLRWLLFWENS